MKMTPKSVAALKKGSILITKNAIITALSFGALYLFGVRVNTTNSLPMGIWVQMDQRIAEYVEFCMPEGEARDVAIKRGYLYQGLCPEGGEPLLKPVAAKVGDVVVVQGDELTVNGGKPYPIVQIDRKGRTMPRVDQGVYVVREGEIWVVSDYNIRSFDSRYFGPIKKSSVIAGMKPVWTFDVKEK